MGAVEDLGQLLQAEGFGTLGQTIFLRNRTVFRDPPGSQIPDKILGLFDIPGLPPAQTHDSGGPSVEYPHVQLRWRSAPYDYVWPSTQAHAVFLLFGSIANQVLNGVFYQQILPLESPFGQPEDEWNRPYTVLEVRCAKQP